MKIINADGHLNADVADVLYELGNVGVGMASVALGKIMGVRISIKAPMVIPLEAGLAHLASPDPERITLGILMAMEQNLGGAVLFLLDKHFVTLVIEKMTGTLYEDDDLIEDEDSLSALQEFANIIAAAYMNAIGSYCELRMFLSPVMVGMDMVGALLSTSIAQLSLTCDMAICIDTSFALTGETGEQTSEWGHIVMLPNEDSLQTMMRLLRL